MTLRQELSFLLLVDDPYDVFGVEKGLRKPVTVNGVKNKKFKATFENGEPCDYAIVDAVYEVYDLKALENIDYNRYYPARGYYKKIK